MRFLDFGLGMTLSVGLAAALTTNCGSGGTKKAFDPPQGGTSSGGSAGDGPGGEGGDGGSSGTATGGTATGGSAGSGGVPPGGGVGDACDSGAPCRRGLECVSGACEPGGTLDPGSPCTIQPECATGLQCLNGTCGPAGDGDEGDGCTSDADCRDGLRCALVGLGGSCVPQGNGDVDDACDSSTECFAGLSCVNGACGRAIPRPWAGVECEPPVEDGEEVRAFFEVPGAPDADEGDFFRLPFPNDARRTGARLDLSGFPTPGPGVLGIDPVALYVDALEANDAAWGTFSTVHFRFSGRLDIESLRQGGTMGWVDVTPGAAELGHSRGLYWYYSNGRTPYLCENWLGVRRPIGQPLLPGHTYAVWLTTDIVALEGGTIRRAPNLVAVLDDDAPSDETLEAVHARYAPFREYLAAENRDPSTILTATVFTVGEPLRTMEELAETIADLDPPEASDWVECDEDVESPCPDAEGERACGAPTDDYTEYHALVSLPVFQEGTAPYLTPDEGGGIVIDADPPGEEVCLSLTVPTGTAPSEGFPLVVSAHGTGGSFRSHVTASVAGALSSGAVKFAVLGIDQVVHGPRRGASTESPENLFFNFLNPAAARGNPLQGAADQLSLARFAATLDGTGGSPVRIDPANIVFFGHSQGATHGSLMLPYADGYRAAVLSGNGASLMYALINKTSPVNIKGVLPLVLQDPSLGDGTAEYHPVLSLLQQWIDPADPLSFARLLATPPAGHSAKSVFMTFGQGDTFSPEPTLEHYAVAGNFLHVRPALPRSSELPPLGLTEADPPAAGNLEMGQVTLGMRQYRPSSGEDGHFVVFDVPQANDDMVRFLSMAASGDVPEIGE